MTDWWTILWTDDDGETLSAPLFDRVQLLKIVEYLIGRDTRYFQVEAMND